MFGFDSGSQFAQWTEKVIDLCPNGTRFITKGCEQRRQIMDFDKDGPSDRQWEASASLRMPNETTNLGVGSRSN